MNERLADDIAEATPAINCHEASAYEQAMAELDKATNKEFKAIILQKYGVTPVQLTDEELGQCQ